MKDAAKLIANELAAAEIKLVASLPDDWIAELIKTLDVDARFIHVPVNREESAVGLCSGSFFSATGAVALMGALPGLGLSLIALRVTANLVGPVPTFDAVTFVVVPLIAMAIVLAASYIPARRAARLDPMAILRAL